MARPLTMRRIWFAAAVLALGALYLTGLDRMGLVSKDEPRYADIARAMAQTGDWVTPRLNGTPWFEKPPLLYWMAGAGFKTGLGPELAPRLPVALLSVAFIVLFWRKVRALWDEPTANYAAALLATSGGWLALSHVAVTDIPLAVAFSAAVLFALERRTNPSAAALGFAVLAKSLVPLILFIPVLALDARQRRDWLKPQPLLAFAVVALPWHILCAIRNGGAFLQTLFVQQQFGRFFTPERQHVQPWWFYLPVLLLLLFPWFPFLPYAMRLRDANSRMLAAIVVFGFLFFSASLNKLPGYLLPLVPAVCMLMGSGVARAANARIACSATAALAGTVPLIAAILPNALAESLPHALRSLPTQPLWIFILPPALAALAFLANRRAPHAAIVVAAGALFSLQLTVVPELDKTSSARPIWLRERPACVPAGSERGLVYGLNFYAGATLPNCEVLDQTPGRVVR